MQVDKLISDLNDHLTKEFNISSSTINIKVDKICKKLLYICKKNYSYLDDKNEIHSKGLDYIKTSTIKYAAIKQKELLDNILLHGNTDFNSFLEKLKSDFYSIQWTEENIDLITLKIRVTKRPENYTSHNVAAEIAKWMIDQKMNFTPGMFVSIVCTDIIDGKIIGCHPLSKEWIGKVKVDYIYSNQILPKISRITEVLSPQFDWKQYDPQIVEARNRKIIQYEKWLMDTKLNEKIIEKIKNDVVLSEKQKEELIKFGTQNRVSSLW